MFEVLTTPSCWIRNHCTNKTVDDFVRLLIEHKDEVEFCDLSKYEILLKFKGYYYKLWISNRWYAYLSDISQFEKDENGDIRYMGGVKDCLPSRKTAFDFYHTFHEPHMNHVDELKFLEDVLKGETHYD